MCVLKSASKCCSVFGTARIDPRHIIRQPAAQAILVRISSAMSDGRKKPRLFLDVDGTALVVAGSIRPARASSSSSNS